MAGRPREERVEFEDELTEGRLSGRRVHPSARTAYSLFVLQRRGEEEGEEAGTEKDKVSAKAPNTSAALVTYKGRIERQMHDGSGLSGLASRVLAHGWDYEWDWDLHTSIRAVPRPGPPPLSSTLSPFPPRNPPRKRGEGGDSQSNTFPRPLPFLGRRFENACFWTYVDRYQQHMFTSPPSHNHTDVVALSSPPSSMFTRSPRRLWCLLGEGASLLLSCSTPASASSPGYLDLPQTRVPHLLPRPPVVGVHADPADPALAKSHRPPYVIISSFRSAPTPSRLFHLRQQDGPSACKRR
ncbi:hypothetical protein EDB89DRAFT_2064679 [Lactarius sanguifluus]|nr:hypothetical protein EDB89DRAFT_2064679 [Lactarius sanguifluus]